ncbi:MAG TPA: TetR-like C-terminal domain-containing protein [Clostridiaceae bacterium]|nr:TetR-like C-terminal domain-containing protein [Clostridiaceae bacterium]
MGPKVKITEEAILQAALDITRESGIGSVNAREVAKVLGCSIQPVFRNFQNMDNLKKELRERARDMYDAYTQRGMESHKIPFLGIGLAYVEFAQKEKHLFRLLFMSDEFKGQSIIDMIQDEENQGIVQMVSSMSGLSLEKAEQLFLDIWLMTHGIASLVATNDFDVTEGQIEKILKDAFLGIRYQLSQEEEKK